MRRKTSTFSLNFAKKDVDVFFEFCEDVGGDHDVILFATRIILLRKHETARVMLEIIQNDVLFLLEISVERHPSDAGFRNDFGYSDFIVVTSVHKPEKSFDYIGPGIFFGCIIHILYSPSYRFDDTKSAKVFRARCNLLLSPSATYMIHVFHPPVNGTSVQDKTRITSRTYLSYKRRNEKRRKKY